MKTHFSKTKFYFHVPENTTIFFFLPTRFPHGALLEGATDVVLRFSGKIVYKAFSRGGLNILGECVKIVFSEKKFNSHVPENTAISFFFTNSFSSRRIGKRRNCQWISIIGEDSKSSKRHFHGGA
jgi:hypothetical protein